jgi:LysM repeat protein
LKYLSKKFNVSYKDIKKLNHLKNDIIYKNQKLIIPTLIRL